MAKKVGTVLCLIILVLILLGANMFIKSGVNQDLLNSNRNSGEYNDSYKNTSGDDFEQNDVIKITKDNFENEVLNSDKPVLIDFFATWCEPCKMLSPIVAEIAKESEGIKVVKIDVDEEVEIASQYGIISIPTLVLIKDGEEKDRIIGVVPKDVIIEMINIE